MLKKTGVRRDVSDQGQEGNNFSQFLYLYYICLLYIVVLYCCTPPYPHMIPDIYFFAILERRRVINNGEQSGAHGSQEEYETTIFTTRHH